MPYSTDWFNLNTMSFNIKYVAVPIQNQVKYLRDLTQKRFSKNEKIKLSFAFRKKIYMCVCLSNSYLPRKGFVIIYGLENQGKADKNCQ